LIEEAWECISAIDTGDDANLEEELGDLYLLVTMMSWMKEQEGAFTVESALTHIADKLVRRHPHVFAGAVQGSAEQVLVQWDEIKAREKAGSAAAGSASAGSPGTTVPPSSLDGVPASFPPLEKASKLQKKAAKVGFDWPGPQPVWDKIDEELDELRSAVQSGTEGEIEAEIGDILFSVVNLSRILRVDPALALHRTNVKFERRFREVERRLSAAGTGPAEAGLDRMDELWNQVKSEESPTAPSRRAKPVTAESADDEPADGAQRAAK
jgi:MazG family protein